MKQRYFSLVKKTHHFYTTASIGKMYMHTHRASILTIFIAQMKHAIYVPYFFHNRVKAPTLDFSGAHIQHVGRRATGGGGGGGEKGE